MKVYLDICTAKEKALHKEFMAMENRVNLQ